MNVLVLGGGVVGVASAWYLAQAGHQVLVVDRQPDVALETSFANGGQISAEHAEPWARPGLIPKLLKWRGREDAPLLFRPRLDARQWRWALRFLIECLPGRFERNARELVGLALYSRDCLKALRQQTGIHYDERTAGILHLCTNPLDFSVLAEQARAMKRFGVHREVKDAAQCIRLEPALQHAGVGIEGGIYTPRDESGDAHLFSLQLRERLQARGVGFHFESEVHGVDAQGDSVRSVRIRSKAGERRLSADAYLVALGSFSPLLLEPLGISSPIYPLKGYSVTFELDAASEGYAPSLSITDEACKIVISRLGNRLRAAGTAELAGYDTALNAPRCRAIERRVKELFPRLDRLVAVSRWAGLRPATPSNVPVIGRTRFRNLFQNTGHGTLGWTLACGSGSAIADIMSGRKPEARFRFTGL